jgi:hypothetical protein
MPEQLMTSDPPCAEPQPERRGQGWRSALFLVVLLACLGIAVLFIVAIISPSAGAAGGCGGG